MRQRPRFLSRLLCLLLVFCTLLPQTTFAAVRTTALETAQWNTVAEASIIDEGGWLQSMCATDQYIVCLINASRNGTEPDTLIAFYRNTTDPQGNPVKQYSYAFHVTQMDFEHGNGMTYNPNTREIAIAGLFNNGKNNRGAVFIVDADTLQFKRKVTVENGKWNFFGIDYVAEKDQYVLMANRPADYSFIFTDGNFQVTDTLNLGLSSSRSSFQDFCVVGDSIISIPYMQRDGFMNVVDVYSISQKARVGSYYLTLPDSAFSVEPEGICQLEPGHFLMASAVKGSTVFKLYETHLPIYHTITASAENGSVSQQTAEVDPGGSCTITYSSEENFRLQKLVVDGTEVDAAAYPDGYTFTNVQEDHTISAVYEEIPRYTVTTQAQNGTVDVNPSGFEHDPLTVSFAPNEHYELDSLLVDGEEVELRGDETSYTFEDLTTDHTLEVRFKAIPSYTITVEAQNGTVSETKATVYRGESYTTQAVPDRFYSLSRCLVDGRPVLIGTDDNYVLENVSGDHTITLVYTRSGLSVLVPVLLGILVFALLVWLIRSERMKRRRARKKELRHMRRKNRSFFQTLEDLDALEKNPPEGSMKEEELYFLLNELNDPEHDSTRRAQEAESGSEPQNSAQPAGEHGDTINGPDGTAQLPSLPAAGDSPAKDQ